MYNGAHTINEGAFILACGRPLYIFARCADAKIVMLCCAYAAISGEAFVNKIRFHTKFILNWDEATV